MNKLTVLGGALAIASIAVFGTLFSYAASPAAAGDPTPEYTPNPCQDYYGFGEQQCETPTAETPVRIKTHTPTATATAAATETSVPTNTSVPATNTPVPPTGGQEGAGVRPPNTGTGDGAAASSEIWAVILGSVLLTAGAGTFALGMRRR